MRSPWSSGKFLGKVNVPPKRETMPPTLPEQLSFLNVLLTKACARNARFFESFGRGFKLASKQSGEQQYQNEYVCIHKEQRIEVWRTLYVAQHHCRIIVLRSQETIDATHSPKRTKKKKEEIGKHRRCTASLTVVRTSRGGTTISGSAIK